MNAFQQWNRCPERIEIGDDDGPVRLLKCNHLFAIRSGDTGRVPDGVDVEPIGDDFAIARASPTPALGDLELLPVYKEDERSTPAVATKRIFLRLDEGATPQALEAQLHALGLRVAEIPSYAPHCAWLEPESGRIDEALAQLERLRTLPHAANVEPQLLRPRSWKHDSR